MDDLSRPRRRGRRLSAGLSGLAAGVLAGGAALALAGVAVATRTGPAPEVDPGALVEAAHLPPLLTAPGEPAGLRYDIYCAAQGSDPESGAPCDAGGTVYVRAGQAGVFRAVPLRLDAGAAEGRYVAELPREIAGSPAGFSYYAVVRNQSSGASLTLPAGGPAAPQRSVPLAHTAAVSLGRHGFGSTRRADARVAAAAWGDRPDQVGLEGGPEVQPVGASAFDVDAAGTVTVLDQAHRRVLRWAPGARNPDAVPLAIGGTLADMSVAPDGTIYVLESVGSEPGRAPLLRSFDATGRARGEWAVAERTASQVRIGPAGPVTLQYPSGQWMPVAERGLALAKGAQVSRGQSGRPLRDGGEVVVLRSGREVRVALAGENGVRRSWRIASDTDVAEVQLAEPLGGGAVVVLRVYTETDDQFVVLVLDAGGIAQRFAVDSADWAETAPLTRFRLAGSSLYQLGSTEAGIFVDRFDLEVRR